MYEKELKDALHLVTEQKVALKEIRKSRDEWKAKAEYWKMQYDCKKADFYEQGNRADNEIEKLATEASNYEANLDAFYNWIDVLQWEHDYSHSKEASEALFAVLKRFRMIRFHDDVTSNFNPEELNK